MTKDETTEQARERAAQACEKRAKEGGPGAGYWARMARTQRGQR